MRLFIEETDKSVKFISDGKWTYKYPIGETATKIKGIMSKVCGLTESNWGRITDHIKGGCMMISACRGERTEQENEEKTKDLEKDIRAEKLGYVRILGGYIENKGTEKEKEVYESSFFVPKPKDMSDEDFFNIAIKLCAKYDQDDVLVSLPDYCDFGYYKGTGDFDFSPGEKFVANEKEIGQYFSALVYGPRANKKFAFQDNTPALEWIAPRTPNSTIQATFMSKKGEYF